MKEQITTNLFITDVKKQKKKTVIGLLLSVICFTAITAYFTDPFEIFSLPGLLLIASVIFSIATVVIVYRGYSIIRQIQCGNVDIYEDTVVKKVVINGRKRYLVFQNYHPGHASGIAVTDLQYDQCELDDRYYIVCVNTTNAKPHLLVYPVQQYTLSECMEAKLQK